MAKTYLSLTWPCFLNLSCVIMVFGFNLFPKHGVVFKDPSGQNGSYFGYTVALQQEGWLIVGAPRGNSTYPGHVNICEPGVVYQCRIDEDRNCTPKFLDPAGNGPKIEGRYSQYKDYAWIGGSMEAISKANGRLTVCGPVWTNHHYSSSGYEFVSGICYVTNMSNPEKSAQKLIPLNKYPDMYYNKKPTDADFVRNISYFHAFGEAGMSVHFTKDEDETLIGAPGVMDWTGTIIIYKESNTETPIIPNPLRTPVLRNYSYLGYSVSSGNFFGEKTYYVSGAPRAGVEYQGKVYIFNVHVATTTGDEHRLEIVHELEGKEMGEYFGAAVCVLDVNGDGRDDLLVGAPHYGKKRTWDQGRVYVYLTTGNLEFSTQTIVGPQLSGAEYGTALSSLGDINKDGYNDFVVGAPHEESGVGVIYIYHGGKKGPKGEASQRITGSEVRGDILGFGISFSRSLDVDGNLYPDIAVGAYKSGHAVVLKTRPVITYQATIAPYVHSIGIDATSFNLSACIIYKGNDVPSTVDTRIVLTVDEKYHRAEPNKEIKYVQRVHKNKNGCKEHNVRIQRLLQDFSKPIELKMHYMPADEYSTSTRDSRGDEFCKSCAVVDPRKPSFVTSELPYVTGCKRNDMCTPRLSISADINLKTPLIIGSQTTVPMIVAVWNRGEPAFLAYADIYLPDSCSLTTIPDTCEISDDDSDEDNAKTPPTKKLSCLMGNPLPKGEKNTLKLLLDVSKVESGTQDLQFLLFARSAGRDMTPQDNISNLTLSLKTHADIELSGYTNVDGITFSRGKESEKKHFNHIYKMVNFGPSSLNIVDLEFRIPVSYSSGKKLLHLHDIQAWHDEGTVSCTRSDRPSEIGHKMLNVYSNNSEPENTTEEIVSFGDYTPEEYENITESGNRSESEGIMQRVRTFNIETDLAGPEQRPLTDGILSVNCENPKTTCVVARCSLYKPIGKMFKAFVFFNMSANADVLESISGNKQMISFSTMGKAIIRSPNNVEQKEENKHIYVTTTFHGHLKEATIEFVTVALICGSCLLLVIIIVAILCKYGFFKRMRPEERYSAELQKKKDY